MKAFFTALILLNSLSVFADGNVKSNMSADITNDVLYAIEDMAADSFFEDREGKIVSLEFDAQKKELTVEVLFSAVDDDGALNSGCTIPNINSPESIMDKFGLQDHVAQMLIHCFDIR